MKERCKITRNMALESKSFQTEVSMKASGRMALWKDKGN